MPRIAVFLASLALLVPAAATAADEPVVLERSELEVAGPTHLTLAKGATLEVRGLVGEISIVRAKGDVTLISVTRDVSPTAPRIEVLTHSEGVTICTVYASPKPKKPNVCTPGGKGRLTEGVKKESPGVRFRVELPDDVHFVGALWRGNISARAGRSDLRLETTVGDVSITDAGSRVLQAATLAKGDLTVVVSDADARPARRKVHLSVVMGNLDVSIPTGVPVECHILTERTIQTPFKLDSDYMMRTGTLGPAGKPAIDLTLSASMLLGRLVLRPRSD